jgi:exosortase/archaeosortase family protein
MKMALTWNGLLAYVDKKFPEGSASRKLLQIVSVILIFEGLSVLILFSYQGAGVGLFSLALGILVLILLHPGPKEEAQPLPDEKAPRELKIPKEDPPGIKFVDAILKGIGNDYIVMAAGAVIIAIVIVWNMFLSSRAAFGDLDTLTILFGGLVLFFPLLVHKFKVESIFSLMFIGLVVLFLVVPQAVTSLHEGAGSSVGNWYVQYMLAAPFAGILNLVGIHASSSGNIVILHFHDGTVQALSISAYCAGLYSFSIFLAAFFSFVLVFERLPVRILVFVLALGLLVAYLGNLFRMVIIGVVGYYRGLPALLWTHENVGWVIFLSWSALFWYFLLGYVSRRPSRETGKTDVD